MHREPRPGLNPSRSALRRRLARVAAAGVISTVVAAAGLVLDASAGAASRSVAPATKMVPGWLNQLPLATVTGAPSPDTTLTIGVGLQRPDQQGELTAYDAMYDPSSAQYHQFLTPAQFNSQFGVPASQTQAVTSWLTGGGLSIDNSSADGDYITATGTVSQLDALFGVTIQSYVYNGEKFIANDQPPTVPGDLPIDGVLGLDSAHQFALASLHGHKADATPAGSAASTCSSAPDTQSGCELEFTPQELWGIYDDPGAAATTNSDGTSTPSTLASSPYSLGQGQTLGIFGEGETSSVVAQLRLFEHAMGLPKIPVRTYDTEGAPDSAYGDNTGSIEWYLDSQASTGMAPDASQLDLYFAKTLYDPDIAQSFSYWANDPNGPRQMNASFGECEANPTNPVTGPLAQDPYGTEYGDELEAVAEPILRQATMEGRTLFSSAGDTGSGCPEIVVPVAGAGNGVAPQPIPEVNYPCASDYVVCVGGTVVSANGNTYPDASQRSAETSWTYGGGGTSDYIAKPSFQNGVTAIDSDCVTQPDGTLYSTTPQPCRGAPDVSDLSGNITGDGYFIYIDGEPSSEGGTSLSSPLMMGQWTRIQSAASSAGGNGFADPTIYQQAASADTCAAAPCTGAYANEFYDVTESEVPVTGNGAFRPGPGWDYASGWGSLNVANFMQAVDGTTNAAAAAGSPESDAVPVTTATMTSPTGNATDPVDVQDGNDAGLDLTQATLTTSPDGTTITATLTAPDLSSGPPPDAADGDSYLVAWEYGGTVYYARADESTSGTFTYTSGSTATDAYNDTSSSAATGSVDTSTGTITINVPASEVGSPPVGAHLTVPQAFDQLDTGAENLTTDSSDDLTPISQDHGASVSVGEDVVVGGAPATGSTSSGSGSSGSSGSGSSGSSGSGSSGSGSSGSTGSGSSGSGSSGSGSSGSGSGVTAGGSAAACALANNTPITHVQSKQLSSRQLRLAGIANARSCGFVRSVGVALAETVGHRCRFLQRNGRFGRLTVCQPTVYLAATGTTRWSFSHRVRLAPGVYHLWVQAVNGDRLAESKSPRHYIFLRVRPRRP